MKQISLIILALTLLLSCDKKESAPVKNEKKSEFVMYEMSEMAALMEQMYVENAKLRNRIIAGDTLGGYPDFYLKIKTSKMTDIQDNDQFFKDHSQKFLEAQELIYSDKDQAKERFNASVDACIKCHEVKCGGPIARIKKLYIP